MLVVSKNQAKSKANILHKFLSEKGISLPSSEVLNAVARMAGFHDWNALSAQFNEEAVNALLSDHEVQHAHDSLDADQRAEETGSHGCGRERFIQAASGFWMAVSVEPTTDYVRICDPLGREVVYWSAGEFADDPTCVLGALARYLNRDREDLMPHPLKPSLDKLVVADRVKKASKKKRCGLSKLPWDEIRRFSIQNPGVPEEDAAWYMYHDNYSEVLEALDAEREGSATADDIKLLNAESDTVALDWGDEYELEGMETKELRGIKHGPGNTWILKDGRILRFYRFECI